MTRIFLLVLLIFPLMIQYALSQNIRIQVDNSTIRANPPSTHLYGECGANVILNAQISGSSDCTESDLLYFEVEIDNNNDGRINYLATSYCDTTWKNWTLDRIDNVFKKYISPTAQNDILLEVDLGHQNIQRSKVTWKVSDSCESETAIQSEFYVVDVKAPTPYCVGISTFIFSSDKNFLTAKDYDKGSFDNCTPSNQLMYAFDELGPVRELVHQDHYYKASPNKTASIEATEEEFEMGIAYFWNTSLKSAQMYVCLGTGLLSTPHINMYVFDDAFNNDYCTIVFSRGPCIFPVNYKASINHVKGEPITNATIYLKDEEIYCSFGQNNDTSFIYNIQTQKYNIYNIVHRIYIVSAALKDRDNIGIDRHDLKILENHLSNKTPFRHYWQYLAADMNEDKVIDIEDLKLMKSTLKTQHTTRWKIIPNEQEKTIPNWTNIQEEYKMPHIFGPEYFDFTAIKLGDLNGDVLDIKPEIATYDIDLHLNWRSRENFEPSSFIPNPFQSTTQLKIYSEKDQTVSIKIYDMQGRSISQKEVALIVGENILWIDRTELPSTGVYLCKYSFHEQTIIHRLVAID